MCFFRAMEIYIYPTKREMGQAAARLAARRLTDAIDQRGEANLVLATGASQFDMLESLVSRAVDWSKVTAFHLDEYVGLPAGHRASFRRYLRERFVIRAPGLAAFHFINPDDDPAAECRRLGEIIRRRPIDVACVGIGENGHLAFNDPPADFDTDEPYLVVDLDEACRRQQLGEGWFETLDAVPRQAVSMSIRRIMASRCIVCTVPEKRKAQAVRDTLEGSVTDRVPASILQEHDDCHMFLDEDSASMLRDP